MLFLPPSSFLLPPTPFSLTTVVKSSEEQFIINGRWSDSLSNAEWDMSQHSDDHVQTASGLGEPLLGGESKVGKEEECI